MESSHAKENSKLLAALQSLSLNDSADSSNLDKFNQLLHEEASKYSFKSTIKSLLNSLYHLLTSSRQFIFINHSAFKKVNWAALIPVLEQIVVANPSCLPSYEKWLFDQTYKPSIKKDAFQLLGELYLQVFILLMLVCFFMLIRLVWVYLQNTKNSCFCKRARFSSYDFLLGHLIF